MVRNAWHIVGIVCSMAFVVSMFGGYYWCTSNDSCVAPFSSKIDTITQNDYQSRLIQDKSALQKRRESLLYTLQLRRAERAKQATATPTVMLKPPVTPTPDSPLQPVSVASKQSLLTMADLGNNIKIIPVGRATIRNEEMQGILTMLTPFRSLLSRFDLSIYIYYGDQPLGKGIRAFVTKNGAIMNLVAMNSYFRDISVSEFVNFSTHEMEHVIHDSILSDSDRLQLERQYASRIADLGVSDYGASVDIYEFAAENILFAQLADYAAFVKDRPELADFYDFWFSRAPLADFVSLKTDQNLDYTAKRPAYKDATKISRILTP